MTTNFEYYHPVSEDVLKTVEKVGGWISVSDLSRHYSGDSITTDESGFTIITRSIPKLHVFVFRRDVPILPPFEREVCIAHSLVMDGMLRRSTRGGVRGFLRVHTPDGRCKKKPND